MSVLKKKQFVLTNLFDLSFMFFFNSLQFKKD